MTLYSKSRPLRKVNMATVENQGIHPSLGPSGIREIVMSTVRPIIHLAILLTAAGRMDWVNAWIYFAMVLFFIVGYAVIFAVWYPELLNQRGKFIRENTKGFDKAFYACALPLIITLMTVIGLDGGRYQWSSPPVYLSVIAGVGLAITWCFSMWAMAVNTHFETTVRIQTDRGHAVCTRGPYRFVRHPGYAGFVVTCLCAPVMLGSYWGLIPSGLFVLLILMRTALEDRTLLAELPGYKDYASKTRYRLIPGVW